MTHEEMQQEQQRALEVAGAKNIGSLPPGGMGGHIDDAYIRVFVDDWERGIQKDSVIITDAWSNATRNGLEIGRWNGTNLEDLAEQAVNAAKQKL